MAEPHWVEHAIWWHVYPLGFVGAETAAPAPDRPVSHRLSHLNDWLDYAVDLGVSGLALGPVFASETHGYDTTDYYRIDPRLGDGADFRPTWPEGGWVPGSEPGYEDFEGHHHLVALNHGEPEVASFVVDVMKHWLARGVDGWRLDAAYAVPSAFCPRGGRGFLGFGNAI